MPFASAPASSPMVAAASSQRSTSRDRTSDADSPFSDWILTEGWGRNWGIFVVSKADFRTLRQHFRSLLTVYDPDKVPLFFRYYDPRVMRVYLPTCNADELETVFGPVDRYVLEAEDGQSPLRCELKDGALVCR